MSFRSFPKRVRDKFLVLFLAFFAAQNVSAQQPWTRAKGHFYAQGGGSFLAANSLLNGSADLIPLGREVKDATFQTFGEYGLSDRLMVSGSVPLKFLSVKNVENTTTPDGSLTAFSNLGAALTYRFFKKNSLVASIKGSISAKTARFDEKTGLRSGFGSWAFAPSVLAGVGKKRFFSSAELGFSARSNGQSDRLFGAFQIGWPVGKTKKWLPILALEFAESLDKKSAFDESTARTTGLYLDGQSFVSPQLKLGRKIGSKIWIWGAAGFAVPGTAREIAASPGFSLAVGYEH